MFNMRRILASGALLAALYFTGSAAAEAQVRIPHVVSCTRTIGADGTESWSGSHLCLGLEVFGSTTFTCIERPGTTCQPLTLYRIQARLTETQPGALLTASVFVAGVPSCSFKVTSKNWTAATCKGDANWHPTPPTLRMDGSWLVN